MHISTHLIDSFPLPYCPKSCDKEKLSILPEAHHNAQSSEIFLSFPPIIERAVIFYLLGNPAETLYLSVRDGKLTQYDLSDSGQEKLQFTPFWAGPKLVCSDGLRTRVIESRNYFVLGPIQVKFHIRTRLIKSFRRIFRTWWCGEENLHFTPVHTLRQLKRDEALIPPPQRVVEFRASYG